MEFSDLIHRPDTLYTVQELADAIGMSRPSAALVAASGIGGPIFQKGSRRDIHSSLVPASTLNALVAAPWVTKHPEALVVRVRPARRDPDDPDRPFMGWHPEAAWEDLCRGVGRWWRVRDPEFWHGKTLIATVVGYVAFVGRIKDHHTAPGGAVAFDLERPDDETRAAFRDIDPQAGLDRGPKRVEITQGGVTVHLDATAGWET